MSYTLNIWNPAATTAMVQGSLAEIADRLGKLAQEPASDADRALFNQLAKRLWQHYPSADEADSAADIFEGNLPRDSLTVINRLWTIGLVGGDRLRVLRDVAEHAKKLGLAVYDDQIGIGFDPKVGVVPSQRASDWEDVLQGLREKPKRRFDKTYILKHAVEPLIDKLVKIGFQIIKYEAGCADLNRNLGEVKQSFLCSVSSYSGGIRLQTSIFSAMPLLVHLRDMISEGKGGGG